VEADEVRAQQAPDDLLAPRELLEQLDRREWDVQEEPDPQVRAALTELAGHQLELVVLHPDRRALGRDLVDGLGEPLVDPDVRLPPVPVVRRRDDDVVVERPERVVGEPLVVVLHVLGREVHGVELQAVVLERVGLRVGQPGPADPRAAPRAQDRLQSGDQAARAALPVLRTVGLELEVHGQPVGYHHELGLSVPRHDPPALRLR
jgi:hypothetical protein